MPVPPPLVVATTGRWSPDAPTCAVTVGNFDGVHLGHAAIVHQLTSAARRLGVPSVALTFDPHPAALLRPAAAPALLTTPARRGALLVALGIDAVLVQPVDRALVALPAERFYADILRGRLDAGALVEGADFRFGAGRGGDIGLLESLCRRDGVVLETVAPLSAGGQPVSSSRVRTLVAAGAVGAARELLTAAYRVSGTVVPGARRGAGLGFPTANLAGIPTLLPGAGVYAARAHVPAAAPGGRSVWPAAVHVGPSVSFGALHTTVEAHLIGFSGPLYGTTLDVDFLERLRDTHRFDSVAALQTQLATDVAGAVDVCRALPASPPAGG
jgi:riboflavin kinase/FMN adenylyltransferase